MKAKKKIVRFVSRLDEMDKPLNTSVRRGKWVLIVAGLFGLFMVSFLINPVIQIQSEGTGILFPKQEVDSTVTTVRSAFELPVDSFENHLKSIIYEESIEKE